MKVSLIVLGLVFLGTGCTESNTYARRDQISIGMAKYDFSKITNRPQDYLGQQIQTNGNYDLYRLFLLDSEGKLRPYICKFSPDGILLSIELDKNYEDSAINNAEAIIRYQREMTGTEPMK